MPSIFPPDPDIGDQYSSGDITWEWDGTAWLRTFIGVEDDAVDIAVINEQTASYTLQIADTGRIIEMNVASANTLTVPASTTAGFAIGAKIYVFQKGLGATTITPDSGVTFRSKDSSLVLFGKNSYAFLYKVATDTWVVNIISAADSALPPVGSIMPYALTSAPAGWLICDGTTYNIVDYPALGNALLDTYGGNGTTTFAVPNLKGKSIFGIDSAQTEFDAIGESGGSKTSTSPHTHPIDHNHASENFTSGDQSANHTHAGNTGNPSANHYHGGNTGNVSSDHAHWDYDGDRADLGAGGRYAKTYAVPGDATSGFHANHYHGFNTGNVSAWHTHGYTTGNQSANHTHTTTVDLAELTGTSGASSAEATSGNLPPYMTLQYIIRAL